MTYAKVVREEDKLWKEGCSKWTVGQRLSHTPIDMGSSDLRPLKRHPIEMMEAIDMTLSYWDASKTLKGGVLSASGCQ